MKITQKLILTLPDGSEIELSKDDAESLRDSLIEILGHKKSNNIRRGFEELENVEATWFIDPLYQYGGEFYTENNINFNKLAEWCKTRKGQVIVCENDKANWLDFKPLINIQGQSKKSTECIWTNK